MFYTLEERIRRTQGRTPALGGRLLRYAGVFALTALVFGALYAAIIFLE